MIRACSFIYSLIFFLRSFGSVTQHDDPKNFIETLSISRQDIKTKTAVYTLEIGGESLLARLWFVEHAQRSIDIQYYSFAKDITGLVATDYIVKAADRGVKIRLLIDDAASRMYSYDIRMLDAHENITIKVYNAGLMLGKPNRRLKYFVKNSDRLLRRMHNKTFTIDGEACIMGGRNIADRYFDYDHNYNFRDRDALMIGKAVVEVETSFEKFWNDPLTINYSELSGKKKDSGKNKKYYDRLNKEASDTKKFSTSMREKIKTYSNTITKAIASGKLFWVDQVAFVSDKPGKNEDKTKRMGGICADSMLSVIKQAKHTIDIQSPYFIITVAGKQIIKEAIARGIKIRLLTNSLASTDNFMAFSAYQRDRREILESGIELYEFKPDSKVRYKLMIPEVQEKLNYKSVYGFHSKMIVVDGSIAVIGSYNLDPRSANYNTECIVIIRSKAVAENLSRHVEEELLPENSWPVSKECNPDRKAKFTKKTKAFFCRIIPKKLL
jgi:phosphatidylserine/phosphatidylglycerophosphate/cardiolipin synthase-like enzyme